MVLLFTKYLWYIVISFIINYTQSPIFFNHIVKNHISTRRKNHSPKLYTKALFSAKITSKNRQIVYKIGEWLIFAKYKK